MRPRPGHRASRGTARSADDRLAVGKNPAYPATYTERIAALFGTPERFAAQFAAAVVITPTRLHT